MSTPEKDELRNFAISILIAVTPVIIVGAIFWHSSKKPEPAATVVAKPAPESHPVPPPTQASVKNDQYKKANVQAAQKNVDPPPVTAADIVAKAKSVEREKLVTERRRHVSVLPDPQPKEPEAAPTAPQAADPVKTAPDKAAPEAKPVNCEFRQFPFGVVERRTYASAEMCDQAQKMWRDSLRLQEPDGTINEKHVPRKEPAKMPGIGN